MKKLHYLKVEDFVTVFVGPFNSIKEARAHFKETARLGASAELLEIKTVSAEFVAKQMEETGDVVLDAELTEIFTPEEDMEACKQL